MFISTSMSCVLTPPLLVLDGVKVDVQCILETLKGRLGGMVELTRQYHQALCAFIARSFPVHCLHEPTLMQFTGTSKLRSICHLFSYWNLFYGKLNCCSYMFVQLWIYLLLL